MARNRVVKATSRVLKRYFPEREFILRTEGRVVYLRISRGIQFAVLALIFAGVGWSAFSSIGLFASERIIEAAFAHARRTGKTKVTVVTSSLLRMTLPRS